MPRQKIPPPEVTNRKNLLHKEPSVINEQMILSSLDVLLPAGDQGKFARLDGIKSREAPHLLLEFQNVSQIANLSHMVSLTKLQLCNNIITKIEKLDSLVNLVWLDLSFNSIKKIENLENLRKLESINLHRNLITTLENLDNQLRLEIFIVSSNGIRSFEQVKYLRRFVRLQSVNLDGNPISSEAHYRPYAIALLPQVTLLDYVRISSQERNAATKQFQQRLEKIAATDDKLRRRASVYEADEAVKATYAQAFVDGFEEDQFWIKLYAQDHDGRVALLIGDTGDVQAMYHELFRRASKDLFDKGMANYTMRTNEVKAFNDALREEKDVVKAQGQEVSEEFVLWSKNSVKTMRGWVNMIDDLERRVGTADLEKFPDDQRVKYDEYHNKLNACVLEYISNLHDVWYVIMTTEMGLHEQIMEVNQQLDRALQELVGSWLEQLRGYVGVFRDIQIQFNERLVEDLVTYGNFRLSDTTIPEKLHYLLKDKEALSAVIQASHENHNAYIDSREENMVTSLRKWLENAVISLGRDEIHRNRMRVSEISHFIDFHRQYLDDKHIMSYVTCFVPDLRGDQNEVPPEDSEVHIMSEADKYSKTRISETLLNLTKLTTPNPDGSMRKSTSSDTKQGSSKKNSRSKSKASFN